jgi:hypothetical protein
MSILEDMYHLTPRPVCVHYAQPQTLYIKRISTFTCPIVWCQFGWICPEPSSVELVPKHTGSLETQSRNAFAMSCCNASRASVVMRHRLVTEIVVNLMLFKVDVLIHIPVPRLQDRRS